MFSSEWSANSQLTMIPLKCPLWLEFSNSMRAKSCVLVLGPTKGLNPDISLGWQQAMKGEDIWGRKPTHRRTNMQKHMRKPQ